MLRCIGYDGLLVSVATYYLHGTALYLSEQLRLHDPAVRFEGSPVGRIEISCCRRLRVMLELEQIGDLEADIFTDAQGQRFRLSEIQL